MRTWRIVILVLLALFILGIMTGVITGHFDYSYTTNGKKHTYVYGDDKYAKEHQHTMTNPRFK